ncbi:MAG: BTAD domain-containing putative transcriptional regulator [Gemmatimonadota bacterium]
MTDPTPSYQRFFAELKRRRVFRVMAVYGAVAFGVLQAADVLIPALHLPGSMITGVAALSLLGFPLAIALAWVFDRTPEGLTRTPDAASGEIARITSQPAGRRWPAGVAAVIGTALLVSGAWWAFGRAGDAGPIVVNGSPSSVVPAAPTGDTGSAGVANPRADENSIAVLPFVNMSGDPENEYFSDGLSEELINTLVMIDGLKVAARTSAFAFRGQERDVREIGAELGVAHVLEGSVRRAGERVRITAQLIQTEDGFHLWSETYDRQLDDIFAVQEEIAVAISEQLELTLTPENRSTLARRRTEDLEAYDLYLLGRHSWATRSDEGLVKAREYFEAAIELDSEFAPAWAGLAAVYDALPWYTDFPAMEAAEKGRQAALRAVALDPTLAEAHAALGVILYEFFHDWDGAAAAFDDMRAADPDYAQGLSWECLFRTIIGRAEDALPECRRAVSLDPVAGHPHWNLSTALVASGRIEEGLASYDRAAQDLPDVPEVRFEKAAVLLSENRYEEAATEYEIGLRIDGFTKPEDIRTVIAGITDESANLAGRAALRRLESQDRVTPHVWVQLWAEIGDKDHAIELLERAYELGDPNLLFLGVTPGLREALDDPRTDRIMREIGLQAPASTD